MTSIRRGPKRTVIRGICCLATGFVLARVYPELVTYGADGKLETALLRALRHAAQRVAEAERPSPG